ncbi:cysteine synthase family protein [Pedobacter kyonggii]|uniref:cysteine synthase family protein n=1 Tax=Pedobacter kyonggii TaxID=1926871 RepID=UPI0013EF2AF3|nr:cysteine synthase family protein [Pedobacter kyonggii]
METFETQDKLIEIIHHLDRRVGNTPLLRLLKSPNLYAKIEYTQFTHSIKIRPAMYIMREAILSGVVNTDTTIIESTSGNFGIALAHICFALNLKFIAVIDSNTPQEKQKMLKLLAYKVVTIDKEDNQGGYLINRIKFVNDYMDDHTNCFNPNQYSNVGNPDSYYYGLSEEIIRSFAHLDVVFLSVSSGGTITGLSRRLKEAYPNIKIVGIDVEGSQIFSSEPKKRRLSGIGSSIRSEVIEMAHIDEFVILSDQAVVDGCKLLYRNELIFAGISSGAAYAVAYRHHEMFPEQTGLFICADDARSYLDFFEEN